MQNELCWSCRSVATPFSDLKPKPSSSVRGIFLRVPSLAARGLAPEPPAAPGAASGASARAVLNSTSNVARRWHIKICLCAERKILKPASGQISFGKVLVSCSAALGINISCEWSCFWCHNLEDGVGSLLSVLLFHLGAQISDFIGGVQCYECRGCLWSCSAPSPGGDIWGVPSFGKGLRRRSMAQLQGDAVGDVQHRLLEERLEPGLKEQE